MIAFRSFLIAGMILLGGQQITFADDPSCPESSSEEKQGQQKESVLRGKLQVHPISKEGDHIFRVHLSTSLPHLTRINVSLYYVRGESPTKVLAYRKTVHTGANGNITANLLGLERKPWAGCYRLLIRFDSKNQVPSVRKQLPERNVVVEREKNWYHGTPEKLKQQKKQAIKRSKRDFYLALRLADKLKEIALEKRQHDQDEYIKLPYSIPVRFPRKWIIQAMVWSAKFKKLKTSNQRRPRFEGRTVPYFYVEDRTAYFLQYDIKRLEKLFQITNRLLWTSNYSQENVQTFRSQYQKLREQIADTMTLLKLVVPLPEEKRDEFRRKLNKMETRFQTLRRHMEDVGSGKQQEVKERIQTTVSRIQSLIFQVNSDVPDVVYKEMSSLAKRLQTFSRTFNQMSFSRKKAFHNELQQQFQDTKKLAVSFLEAKFQ